MQASLRRLQWHTFRLGDALACPASPPHWRPVSWCQAEELRLLGCPLAPRLPGSRPLGAAADSCPLSPRCQYVRPLPSRPMLSQRCADMQKQLWSRRAPLVMEAGCPIRVLPDLWQERCRTASMLASPMREGSGLQLDNTARTCLPHELCAACQAGTWHVQAGTPAGARPSPQTAQRLEPGAASGHEPCCSSLLCVHRQLCCSSSDYSAM